MIDQFINFVIRPPRASLERIEEVDGGEKAKKRKRKAKATTVEMKNAATKQEESLLYEIISGLQTMSTDVASSSSAPPNLSAAKSYNTMVNEDNNTPSRNNPSQLQSLLYEIISGLQTMGTDVASSSSAPPNLSAAKSYVGDLLSDVLFSDITPVAINTMVNEDNNTPSRNNPSQLQDKPNGPNEECLSCTSSNRESWGRCSSLGSNDEPSADCSTADDNHQVTLKMLATPLRNIQCNSLEPQNEEKRRKKKTLTIVKNPDMRNLRP